MGDPAIDVVGLRGWLRSFTTRLPYDVQPNLGHRNDRRGKERQENFLKKKKKDLRGHVRGKTLRVLARTNALCTHPLVAPAGALCGPPRRRASTDHAEEGIEDGDDGSSIAYVARCRAAP